MDELRKLMRNLIDRFGWLDYCFERGDDNAKAFSDYGAWLDSLSNDDFLAAYNRVREIERELD